MRTHLNQQSKATVQSQIRQSTNNLYASAQRKPNYPCLTQKSWAIPFCGDIQGKHINFIHGNAFRLWIKKSCFTTVQSAALGTLLVITAAESVGNDVLGPAISDSQKLLRKDGLHEVVKDFSGVAASKLFEQEIRELVS
ncbi:hypothetical protein Tco_1467457 [Tanacetum coccineum]